MHQIAKFPYRWHFLILGVIIIAIIIAGVYYNNTPKEEKTIKIGVIMPLTGFLANVGIDTKNAIDLAYNDLSASKDVQLIFEDDACDSAKALTAYRKLVDMDKVNYL